MWLNNALLFSVLRAKVMVEVAPLPLLLMLLLLLLLLPPLLLRHALQIATNDVNRRCSRATEDETRERKLVFVCLAENCLLFNITDSHTQIDKGGELMR